MNKEKEIETVTLMVRRYCWGVHGTRGEALVRYSLPQFFFLRSHSDHIRRLGVFPANYALDLGKFIDSNGNSYIDIVELNPISCSMCYVNNSIYADVVPEIGECQRQLMMAAEFCYDAIANPKNYDMLRISNKSYTYTSDNQYALL